MKNQAVGVMLVVGVVLCGACTRFSFKNRGRGTAPSDLRDTNEMIRIPGGSFEMGAIGAEPDEFPAHQVSVSTFLVDRTEVTRGDYQRCVDADVCRSVSLDSDADSVEVTDAHPVVGVGYADASKYCAWVGKRLPTEAEWERAARAPRFQAFPWEGAFDAKKANLRGAGDGFARTAPVGSYPAGMTATGILDMAGNAAEWCSDWYEATYYQKSAATNPQGPEAPTGSRVIRGGSWSDNDFLARTTARQSLDPNVANDAVGFRCVKSSG